MSFTQDQLRQLKGAVARRHVRERRVEGGKTLHYLEGWTVVTEANRIFGFGAWDRETVASECVWRTQVDQRYAAAYLTRVRIRVRAGDQVVVREGLGAGEAIASTPGQAHERAAKAAETDATKRALSTFGARFGLSLYGERTDAAAKAAPQALGEAAARVVRTVGARMKAAARAEKIAYDRPPAHLRAAGATPDTSPPGAVVDAAPLSDAGWRTRGGHPFRREPRAAAAGAGSGRGGGEETGAGGPTAAPARGDGVALKAQSDPDGAGARGPEAGVALLPVRLPDAGPAGRIDKSVLTLAEPSRLRDRDHLRYVAGQPCVVCARTPSQAHHLRIAQPRALGRKVSDEFTVPLCALHHYDLHMRGDEAAWWRAQAIEPLPIADRLWRTRRNGEVEAP